MSLLIVGMILMLLHLDQYEADDNTIGYITRNKCVDELGCFSAGAPFFDIFERPLSLLPDDREDINTTFLLYTPFHTTVPQHFSNLDGSVKDLLRSSFNPLANTKFVIPGYISRIAPNWVDRIVKALLLTNNCNVFLIDWSGGDALLYEQAVANARIVGAEIALFIKHLQDNTGIRPESVHIIGHSLASHIAGYAGKRVKNLGRITAMDPAGPNFINVDPVVRLDRNDALLVDCIHTNAASSRFQGLGTTESIGHFDFYPNGGHLQPGCQDMGEAIWAFLHHPSFDAEGFLEVQCNHLRATDLFISSITNSKCEMMGIQCDSWDNFVAGKCVRCDSGSNATCVPLGIHVDHYASAIKNDRSLNFYLNTTAMPPFCVK